MTFGYLFSCPFIMYFRVIKNIQSNFFGSYLYFQFLKTETRSGPSVITFLKQTLNLVNKGLLQNINVDPKRHPDSDDRNCISENQENLS